MQKNILVGYKRFKGGNGQHYCIANIMTDYSKRELQKECYGRKVSEVFLPDEQYNYLQPQAIGKAVELMYQVDGNRAYLIEFRVL